MPAYQSIMVGRTQSCLTNSCGRIKVETVQERVLREQKLRKSDVATFASWEKIPDAVEHQEGQTVVNAGIQAVQDGVIDSVTQELNRKQNEDRPSWGSARKDQYTFAHAMHYLKNNKPRFLFISLNDSDEWGHQGNYPKYLKSLHQYDEWIKNLIDTLSEMGAYGRSTSLIITTDHGRGDGGNWKHHGFVFPESKYIWIYGRNPNLRGIEPRVSKKYTHLDIRPTLEKLLGLNPIQCEGCGKVIQELVQP